MAQDANRGIFKAYGMVLRSRARSIRKSASAIISVLLIGIATSNPADAHSFRDQLRNKLEIVCDPMSPLQKDNNLGPLCLNISNGTGPVGSVFSSTGTSPQ